MGGKRARAEHPKIHVYLTLRALVPDFADARCAEPLEGYMAK